MYTGRKKISNIDYIYIWTFLFSLLMFIYFTFESYWLGELEFYSGITVTNNVDKFKRLSGLIMLIISLLFFHRGYSIGKLTALGKCMFIFSIYLILSCIFSKDLGNISNYINRYISMSLWIYVYLFFYTLNLRYDIDKHITKFIIFFAILSATLFLRNYLMNIEIGHTDWHYIESYYMITLIPSYILLKKKYKYILLISTIICSIISAKRTGLITSCIIIVLYFIFIGENLTKKMKSIIWGSVIIITLFFAMSTFMGDQLNFVIERITSIEEDKGSGRGNIYTNLYNEISENDDPSTYLFGKGYNEVINSKATSGYSAHNEFLEVIYDYGFIGFCLFIAIFIVVYNIKKKTKSHSHKVAITLSFIIFLLFSLTSHTILFTTNIIFLCMFWGYNDAKNKIQNTKILKLQ